MVKLYKQSSNRKNKFIGGIETEKYFIECKPTRDIEKWLTQTNPIDIKKERAIIEALLQDERFQKDLKVIVKMSESKTIEKEYDIANKLKNIPGFILFICKMSCKDNLDRYIHKNIKICSQNDTDHLYNLLIMPYISGGSMRVYNFIDKPDKLISCLSQLIVSLFLAFKEHGFLHTDIHLDNVLLRKTKKINIKYNDIEIKSEGLQICIMDFDLSFIGVDIKQNISLFYKDIQKIFYELDYKMKLEFTNQKEIMKLIEFKINNTASTLKLDVNDILELVKNITYVNKQPEPTLKYNPNIF